LHSADRSWIESPSGASAGKFLLVRTLCYFFVDSRAFGERLKKKNRLDCAWGSLIVFTAAAVALMIERRGLNYVCGDGGGAVPPE
jgi:hypothetical protein